MMSAALEERPAALREEETTTGKSKGMSMKLWREIWRDMRSFFIVAGVVLIVLMWWAMIEDFRRVSCRHDNRQRLDFAMQIRLNELDLRLLEVETRQKNGESLWVHLGKKAGEERRSAVLEERPAALREEEKK